MKVYRVWVDSDKVGWDDYDSCVIVAESPEDALTVLEESRERRDYTTDCRFRAGQGEIHVTEVDLNKKDVVCASFNAG